jgi:ketosteroid isomerase-like protein
MVTKCFSIRRKTMTTKQEIKEKFLRWMEAINSRDLSAIDRVADELFTADYVWHFPGFTGLQPGPAGVKSMFREILAGNPNLKPTLEELLVDGNMVAMRATLRRTDPETGKPQRCADLGISRMVGDKTAEDWELLGPWEDDA